MRIAKFVLVAVLVFIAIPKSLHALGKSGGASPQSIVPPRIAKISPSVFLRGTTTTALIEGTNLQDVTAVAVSQEGISASIIAVGGSAVGLTIVTAPDAAFGRVTLSVMAAAGFDFVIFSVVSGKWSQSQGGPIVSRDGGTLTKLLDGRLLLAGGSDRFLATELYEPDSDTWSAAGFLTEPRQGHTATLLPDGRVLIVGGRAARALGTTGRTAELWDAASQSWTPTEPMSSARRGHAATLLPDGRVLVTGGVDATTLPRAEIYDSVNQVWSDVPGMLVHRRGHATTLLQDGRVLISSGTGRSVEIFDPVTEVWTLAPPLNFDHVAGQTTLLPDGNVLFTGGPNTTIDGAAEVFDPIQGVWTATDPQPGFPGPLSNAVLLPEGRVLVADGRDRGTTHLFDWRDRSWIEEGPVDRFFGVRDAILLNTGQAVFGEATLLYSPGFATPVPTLVAIDEAVVDDGKLVSVYLRGEDFVANSSVRFIHDDGSPFSPPTETAVRAIYLGQNKLLAFVSSVEIAFDAETSLRVVNPGPGGGASGAFALETGTAVPSLTRIAPSGVAAGRSIAVALTGTGLEGVTLVSFSGDGVSATIQPEGTGDMLSVLLEITSEASPGARTVTVTTPSGSATLDDFTILSPEIAHSAVAPLPIADVESGPIRTGYVVVTPADGSPRAVASLTYGIVRNGIVQSQAAVPPSELAEEVVFYLDTVTDIGRRFGVGLLNPTSIANVVSATLRNNSGSVVGSGAEIRLDAFDSLARFVDEVFSTSDIFSEPFEGSVILSSPIPFVGLGFSFNGSSFSTVDTRLGDPSTPLPTRQLSGSAITDEGTIGGGAAVPFAQFALGGGWSSQIALVNNTDEIIAGRVDVFDPNGAPMAVTFNGQTRSTFTYAIPAGGAILLAPRDANGQPPM